MLPTEPLGSNRPLPIPKTTIGNATNNARGGQPSASSAIVASAPMQMKPPCRINRAPLTRPAHRRVHELPITKPAAGIAPKKGKCRVPLVSMR